MCYTFSEVAAILIAQFHSLMTSYRDARRRRSAPGRAVFQHAVNFYRWIAARIKNFARKENAYLKHRAIVTLFCILEKLCQPAHS